MSALVMWAVGIVALLGSCSNNPIYDDEGDCSVNYRLRFVYERNLKWADAFANEVKSVRLYAFDERGILVREFRENGEQLAADGYTMDLVLPAGKYQLLAWCGIDNPGAPDGAFTVPQATPGVTRMEDLTCRTGRMAKDGYEAWTDVRLPFMFHGRLNVELPANDDGGDYFYTMPLTKDTNHFRIILQHLSGEDLDVRQFDFRMEDANGLLAYDNSLMADDLLTYGPYDTLAGTAGIVKDEPEAAADSRALVYARTAIADFMVGRVTKERERNMILTITSREDGHTVARIPVIQYGLLGKPYYEELYGHRMGEQEFLDRQDEYIMTFVLDDNLRWISSVIMIESWRIVLHDYDVQ